MKKILLLLLSILPLVALGQKKPLDHSVYDDWKSLSRSKICDDAQFISYEINPQQGDGNLYLYNIKSKNLDSFERANSSIFSPGSEYFVFKVKPEYDSTRQAKKEKKKPDQMPKDNIGIKLLPSGEVKMIERVKSFKLPVDEGLWMAYLKEEALPEKKDKNDDGEEVEEPEEKEAEGEEDDKKDKEKSDGTELHILNPLNDSDYMYENVINYIVSDNASAIAYVQVITDTSKIEHYTVSVFNTKSEDNTEIFSGEGKLKDLIVNKDGRKFAFIYSSDTSEVKVFDLYLSDGSTANRIIDIETAGMPEGWSVSENGRLSFSDSGERLFFGTAEKPLEEAEDTLLADEKYKLDIWSWHDPLLQPQQKKQLSMEEKRNYQAVYHIAEKKMIQLADKEMPSLRLLKNKDGDLAIGSSNLKYRIFASWDANRYSDYYLVDVITGDRKMLIEKAPSTVSFSPAGEYMLFWCIKTKNWLVQPTAGGAIINLTEKLNVDFFNELHDTPGEARPYGQAAWVEGERYVLIYDRYDIWKMDVTAKDSPLLLTNGFGRKNSINFRYTRLGISANDKPYLEEKETIYMTAFNELTKDAGLYTVKINKPADPAKVTMGAYSYRGFRKAKEKDVLIWQRGIMEEYPELYVSDMKLSDPLKISETNPQQSDYIWGTSELVEWTSFDGQEYDICLWRYPLGLRNVTYVPV